MDDAQSDEEFFLPAFFVAFAPSVPRKGCTSGVWWAPRLQGSPGFAAHPSPQWSSAIVCCVPKNTVGDGSKKCQTTVGGVQPPNFSVKMVPWHVCHRKEFSLGGWMVPSLRPGGPRASLAGIPPPPHLPSPLAARSAARGAHQRGGSPAEVPGRVAAVLGGAGLDRAVPAPAGWRGGPGPPHRRGAPAADVAADAGVRRGLTIQRNT